MKDSKAKGGTSLLGEGLSSKSTFNSKDGAAKASATGRVTKRPVESAGRGGYKIKGRS